MRSCLLGVVSAGVLAAAAGAPAATFTTVQPAPGGELGHAAILSNIYGGSFVAQATPTPSFSNGGVTATRLADEAGPVNKLSNPGSGDDQEWSNDGSMASITAKAKYAADSHVFGWIDDTTPARSFQPMMSTTDFNNPMSVLLSGAFRFAVQDVSTGGMWTSVDADNMNGGSAHDQMVTYVVTGAGITKPTYLLFWEDRIGAGSDYDYNDAVIEVSVNSVPAPGVAGVMGAGLLAATRRRRS